MPISRQQVDYVAHLSRLALSEEEKELFAEQLDEILESMEKLNELDTEQVEPLVHIAPRRNVFREDQTAEPLSREEALANAPENSEGCFRVPRIID